MSFRDEIFRLCKNIQKNPNTKTVETLLHELTVVKDGEEIIPANSFFIDVAKHCQNQFYGFLYTNEHTDECKKVFPLITTLPTEDIHVFARAHATIYALVNGCLSELRKTNPKIATAIDPYSKYKSITLKQETSYLSTEQYEKAAKAFRETPLYKKLISSSMNEFVEQMKSQDIYTMFAVLEKELNDCPLDVFPNSLENLAKCLHTEFKKMEELLMAEAMLILALRKALENACSLLYTALVGEDLYVFNNDNIISYDKDYSNSFRRIIQINVSGIFLNGKTNTVGDIALIDCDPHQGHHVHEFGIIYSCSANFDQEMGNTSKFTMVIVDDSLDPFYLFTNKIIEKDFPPIVKEVE